MALDTATVTRLEQFVGDWLTDSNVPGASLAISRDDDIVYASGFGSRTLETNEPATAETLYGVASCTKSFTALSILLLEEREKLSVDDPVSAYLDELTLTDDAPPITLHELLTHSSGVPSLKFSEVLLSRLTGLEEYGVPLGNRDDFYRHVNGARDERAVDGEYVMYNNSGYILLGEVIATVSGIPFEAFVESEILDPLGMERSTFDPDNVDDGLMTPYVLRDGTPESTPFPHRPLSYAAGGLIAPVTELLSYLELQTNGGTVDGVELLSSDTLARAHAEQVTRNGNPYGYGWEQTTVCGRTLVGHGGSLGVSSSYIGFTEDGEYAIALAANTTPAPTPPTVAEGILAILDGNEPGEDVSYFARTERFEELTGEYESYRGITTATVERHGSVLELTTEHALDEQTVLLVPTNPEKPGYEFEIPTMNGTRTRAQFDVHDDHVDLYYDRNRLHKRK